MAQVAQLPRISIPTRGHRSRPVPENPTGMFGWFSEVRTLVYRSPRARRSRSGVSASDRSFSGVLAPARRCPGSRRRLRICVGHFQQLPWSRQRRSYPFTPLESAWMAFSRGTRGVRGARRAVPLMLFAVPPSLDAACPYAAPTSHPPPGRRRGDVPCAVETERRLGSRLRNHFRRLAEPELRVARSERRHQLRHVLAAVHAPKARGGFQHPGRDPA